MQRGIATVICGLSSAVFASAGCAFSREETALDRYVAAFDPIYHYELVNTASGDGFIANVVEMTSLKWRTASEVDSPIWKHWLIIVRPQTVTTSTGLLIISGGSNEKPPPKVNPLLTQLALATGSIVSEVRMVPNQPLVFDGNGQIDRRRDHHL
jgi:PhoPQ-activated pathogenicity-related protein